MDIDRPADDVGVSAPDLVQQLIPLKHPSRSFHERAQQLEFQRSQSDFNSGNIDPMRLNAKLDCANLQDIRATGFAPPKEGSDPSKQFRHRIGFGDVVVSTNIQAANDVFFLLQNLRIGKKPE